MVRFTKLRALSVMMAVTVVMFVLPVSASAATNIFLTLNGIQGESQDARMKDAINVSGFTFEAANPAQPSAGAGGRAGKATLSDITITKHTDKASLPILKALATGKHIPDGTLYVRRAASEQPVTYLKIHLSDVSVTSYSLGSDSEDGVSNETISLHAAEMSFEYTETKPDGSAGTTQKLDIDTAKNTVK